VRVLRGSNNTGANSDSKKAGPQADLAGEEPDGKERAVRVAARARAYGKRTARSGTLLRNAVFPVFIPPPYMTTITVPRAYGHCTGNDHAFMTLPPFIPVAGFSLQVAP
jgi:hypothetical protein